MTAIVNYHVEHRYGVSDLPPEVWICLITNKDLDAILLVGFARRLYIYTVD
jgi:hypothetical protein